MFSLTHLIVFSKYNYSVWFNTCKTLNKLGEKENETVLFTNYLSNTVVDDSKISRLVGNG